MRTITSIAAASILVAGMSFTASAAKAQTYDYSNPRYGHHLTVGPPRVVHPGHHQMRRPPQRPRYVQPRPRPQPVIVIPGPQRQHGGRYASPSHYQSGGHMHGNRRVLVKRTFVRRVMVPAAAGAAAGAAIASRPMPPLQPQVPPPGMQSSPGATPVNTAQPIRYTGPMGSCTRSDGSPGRAGLSPDGRPACYRF